mmetsp:Transcript_12536/g.30759  ORF Transcript_12536/g.30759 Transcript_12536/m.30759 type:complete len:234 (-) Transcript_12536:178-879(-)
MRRRCAFSEPLWQLSSVTKLVGHALYNEPALPKVFPSLMALSCDAADDSIHVFARLPSLTHLFLWAAPYAGESELEQARQEGRQEVTGGLGDTGLAALSRLTGLKELRVDGCGHALTDDGWVRFAAHHPHLTKFDLTSCFAISSVGLIRALPSLQNCLAHVSLSECTGVDVGFVAALAAFCPRHLACLEITDCPRITAAGVRAALAGSAAGPLLDVQVKWKRARATHVLTAHA